MLCFNYALDLAYETTPTFSLILQIEVRLLTQSTALYINDVTLFVHHQRFMRETMDKCKGKWEMRTGTEQAPSWSVVFYYSLCPFVYTFIIVNT